MPFWPAPDWGKAGHDDGDIEPFTVGGSSGSGQEVKSATARFPAGEAPDAEMSLPKVPLVPGEASDQGAGEKFPVKVQVALVAPSREEYERHVVTHYSYRSWCRHCVFGAGRRHKHV